MSRTLFVVLAVLALIFSVSAQSNSSSSSSSAGSISSSSSFVTASSSTGVRSSSSSSSPSTSTGSNGGGGPSTSNFTTSSSSSSTGYSGTYPSNSIAVSMVIQVNSSLNTSQAVNLIQQDIAFNLAAETGSTTAAIVPYIVITSFNGQTLAPASRRLLQTGTPITFIILGNITQLGLASVADVTAVANSFKAAAATGSLQAPFSGSVIPTQTVTVAQPGQTSTGGASAVASAGAALFVAAVASLALLL